MDILLATHHPIGKGADAIRALHFAHAFAAAGHQATIIAAADTPSPSWHQETVQNGVTILSPPNLLPAAVHRRGFGPVDMLARRRLLQRRRPDVLITFGPRPVVHYLGSAARSIGIPVVADWSDLWGYGGIASQRGWLGRKTVGWIDHRLELASRRRSTGLTVVSDYLRQRALEMGVPADRILKLPPAAPSLTIHPEDQTAARKELGLPTDVPIVLYSGRSKFERHFAAETFKEILRLSDEVHLLMVGWKAPETRLGLLGPKEASRLLAPGFVSQQELATHLAACDLVIIPLPPNELSRARMPLRLGEAMAAGKLVVATDVGDMADFIKKEGIGMVADTPQELAQLALNLARDKSRAKAMGSHSRKLAEGLYSWDRVAGDVLNFFERIRQTI